MARDNVPVQLMTENLNLAQGAGVTIVVANGGNIPAKGVTDDLVLIVNNTFAGTLNFTVRAGIYPPAFRQGMGDLVLALTQAIHMIHIESARFVQADGSINVDYQATFTGFIWCFQLPFEAGV